MAIDVRQDGATRRSFIKGIAAAGASTAAAAALDAAGIADLMGDNAVAGHRGRGGFGKFDAIAASSADVLEVPEGFRADVVISWGDAFANSDGTQLRYGFNNDFLAFFPLGHKSDEGLIFVNHEYPAAFFQHGQTDPAKKTPEQIAIEQDSVGNAVVHIRRRRGGTWKVISPSPYNRRITGKSPVCEFTGPLKGQTAGLIIGDTANGSVANCSGGITPWGTALSCEENFQDTSSWGGEYDLTKYAKYGWVVETDPYDASSTPRKHTALGRFRHENTAFRAVKDRKFVIYMGDDKTNEGVYKFVSAREYNPHRRSSNLKILEEGTLYIARWEPEGRRRFAKAGDTEPITATSGTGTWVEVLDSELDDTATKLRVRLADYDTHFAANRPEDLEVDEDGTVYIAFTNNSTVNDSHGAVRKLVEDGSDPEAMSFTWVDYAEGGPTGRPDAGEAGFSCCDNLVFDKRGNLWVVTDISSASLKGSTTPKAEYEYHGNNALFYIPRSGPNKGIAFRFANMPVEAEGTGPYFTPDESALFVNVQHPGEETPSKTGADPNNPQTFSSWWPDGNRTAGEGVAGKPRPSTVVITRSKDGSNVIPPPG
jgi:uncharacterized protein